jgi:hypothetical protein
MNEISTMTTMKFNEEEERIKFITKSSVHDNNDFNERIKFNEEGTHMLCEPELYPNIVSFPI